MAKTNKRYAPEFRRRMVELVRAGRCDAGFQRGGTSRCPEQQMVNLAGEQRDRLGCLG
jgi:hypothetical protein